MKKALHWFKTKIVMTSFKESDTTEAIPTLQLKLLHCTDTWIGKVIQALLTQIDLWSKKKKKKSKTDNTDLGKPLLINALMSF